MEMQLHWAHPIVREWFVNRFGTATEPQEQGWPHILSGKNTLISAPTGSGKTLAAFLACIDALVRKAVSGQLIDSCEVVYISPLRALSNDIERNLQIPLSEIQALAKHQGLNMPPIRTALRTGDTLTRDRLRMLRYPPHILVTTPESLYILLTAEKSRSILRNVRTVIVDEIHAVLGDKRGAHLALSLERLSALASAPPARIGLSATQNPIEEVARFLCGQADGGAASEAAIVNVTPRRKFDLAVEVPDSELGPVASHELWNEVEERIAMLAREHRATLVFVNTRKLAERTAHRLAKQLGENQVAAHHGSLSRKLRHAAERKLKDGELKLLVATASLELGIDIGSVDLVCQIGSTRSIATALQRIGRSGHWRGATPRGRFFPTTRDELIECAAVVRAIRAGDLDRLLMPQAPLDILAQQLAAICSAEECDEDSLFRLVRRAYPYRNLLRAEFDSILKMLCDGVAFSRGRYGAYLHRDEVNRIVRPRRGTRLIAITSGGAIPETGLFTVVAEPEGNIVGTLDEDFAVESNRGDIMLLGNTSWMIRRVETKSARVLVEDAHGAPPSVPFWRGEAPSRTQELSAYVAQLREMVDTSGNTSDAMRMLMEEYGVDSSGAQQIVEYIAQGRAVLGAVPTQTTIVAERFFDESGGMQLVIHAPFGARINKAWGLALRKRFCRSFNLELQAAATDDGINISLTEQHSFPLSDVFRFVHSNTVESVLTQAALASPLFGTRWRWDAMRSLALARFQRGKKVPLQILRMRAEDLLASVFPEAAACQDNIVGEIEPPDHPLVNETMKDVLREAMDVDGLKEILQRIRSGSIRCIAADTTIASPFSHEILNANPYAYLDDAPLEERRSRAVSMRRILPASVASEIGRLDAAAIAEVREQSWPDVRTAEELHDALLSLIVFPAGLSNSPHCERWTEHLHHLIAQRRAGIFVDDGTEFWFAAERANSVRAIYSQASIVVAPAKLEQMEIAEEEAVYGMIRGWMSVVGPTTSSELSAMLHATRSDVEVSLHRLESTGSALRGTFTHAAADSQETEWCDRKLLARIHRLTLGTLRKQIEPVTAAQFLRWLFRWQHVAPGTQLRGERGALEALRQLQGFEVPARELERHILRARITDYQTTLIDRLCWTGAIGWGRFSSPSVWKSSRKLIPGTAAPISFFLREEYPWLQLQNCEQVEPHLSSEARTILNVLRRHGASFLADLARASALHKSQVEEALWQLVTFGLVTADGYDSLRSLLQNRRKRRHGIRSGAGRWSLLTQSEQNDSEKRIETACRVLLGRYGIVFRDLLQRETLIPRWRELLQMLRRMEDRGEVRGGRFVSGFVGEQFALPSAVDSLRAIRRMEPAGEIVVVSAADPLNLAGIIVPGERISAVSRSPVVFRDASLQ